MRRLCLLLAICVGLGGWTAWASGPASEARPHQAAYKAPEAGAEALPVVTTALPVSEPVEAPTVPPVTEPPRSEPPPTAPPASTPTAPSARSDAWWEAIANCESGNTNGWRTGYYGIEAGYAIGDMSKADQLAWAKRIYASYGDKAWGCSPVAWSYVPSG